MFKPLLAAKADLNRIEYPVLVSPKLDGIRCLMIDGVAYSRSMKPIPNQYIQEQLKGLQGLDGELMLRSGDYNDVQSAVMKRTGEPDFRYWVFDCFDDHCKDKPFNRRLGYAQTNTFDSDAFRYLEDVTHHLVINEAQLMEYHFEFCEAGYEGTMIRNPEGRYKNGRSTVKEGILLKLKDFNDAEAVLVEVTEKFHNTNKLEQDELGYAKRSSKKENLVPSGTAGSVVLNWNGIEFRAGFGPGIDDATKQWLFNTRGSHIGETVKFSYQELSKDGIPRFGKMLGFRTDEDL